MRRLTGFPHRRRFDGVRGRAMRMVNWQVYVPIAMTVLLVWVAAGQISLFGHALEWLKRA